MVQTRRSSFAIPCLPSASLLSNRKLGYGRQQSQRLEQKEAEDAVPLPPKVPKPSTSVPTTMSTTTQQCASAANVKENSDAPTATYYSPTSDHLFSKEKDAMEEATLSETATRTRKRIPALESTSQALSLDRSKSNSPPKLTKNENSAMVANSKNYFLCDINLDHCSALSIPDPPSPVPVRNTRRQSSPFLQVPFCDVTNKKGGNSTSLSLSTTNLSKEATNSNVNIKQPSITKRSRKSLCHVPSPNISISESSSSQNKSMAVASKADPAELANEGLVLCVEDDDDPFHNSNKKERKKRQSNFLPRHTNNVDKPSLENVAGVLDRATRKKRQSMLLPSDMDSPTETYPDTSYTKRTKKRQSIMLPSDVELQQQGDQTSQYFHDLKSYQSQAESSAIATPEIQELSGSNENDMAVVRDLVRQFYSIPEASRQSSRQAQEIERVTGYSLFAVADKENPYKQNKELIDGCNTTKDLNWSSSLDSKKESRSILSDMEKKRELFIKIGPVVELIEKKKAAETKRLESSTGCRVEKSRGGKYRYYDTSTNLKINPMEYQARYLADIEQFRITKHMRVVDWMAKEKVVRKAITEIKCVSPRHRQDVPFSSPVTNLTAHDTMTVDDPTSEMHNHQEESMEVCDQDESIMETNESLLVPIATHDKIICNELVLDASESTTPECTKEANFADKQDSSQMNTAAISDDSLLPFPSREEESLDPDVAVAEQTLWLAIDAALVTYSKSIITIQSARQRGIAAKHGSKHP